MDCNSRAINYVNIALRKANLEILPLYGAKMNKSKFYKILYKKFYNKVMDYSCKNVNNFNKDNFDLMFINIESTSKISQYEEKILKRSTQHERILEMFEIFFNNLYNISIKFDRSLINFTDGQSESSFNARAPLIG